MLTSADVVRHDVLFKCKNPVSRRAFKHLLHVMGGKMHDKCTDLTKMNDLKDVIQRGLPLATRLTNQGKPLSLIIATENEKALVKGEVQAKCSTEYTKDTLSTSWGKNTEKHRNALRIANTEDDKIQFHRWITTHMPTKLPKGTFPNDARVVLFSPHEQEVYEADFFEVHSSTYKRVVLMTDIVDNKYRALLQSQPLVEDYVTKAPRGLFQDIGTWEPQSSTGEHPSHIVLHTDEKVSLHNVRKYGTRILPKKNTSKRKRRSNSTKMCKKSAHVQQVPQLFSVDELFGVMAPPEPTVFAPPTTGTMQKMLQESCALANYSCYPCSPAELPQQPVHMIDVIEMPAELAMKSLDVPPLHTEPSTITSPSPTLSLLEGESAVDDNVDDIMSLLDGYHPEEKVDLDELFTQIEQ